MSISLARSSSASSMRAPARRSSARSRVSVVTSSARGRDSESKSAAADPPSCGGRVDQNEPKIFDAARDLGRGRRGNRSAHQLATLRQGAVTKVWHVLTGSSSRAGLRRRTSRPLGISPRRRRPWWSCRPRPRPHRSMPNPCSLSTSARMPAVNSSSSNTPTRPR